VAKTPEQGLQEFRSQSGFADAMKVLRENPLPAVLIVTPRADAAGADAPAVLAGSLGSEPEVDLVQYDAAWRQRLDAILAAATRFGEVLAGLLALAALLVVGNTVRLDILGRAEEITVMQLLGASSAFVRRPFLYTGLWYGAFSATLALTIVLRSTASAGFRRWQRWRSAPRSAGSARGWRPRAICCAERRASRTVRVRSACREARVNWHCAVGRTGFNCRGAQDVLFFTARLTSGNVE
jgi:hypothetical protein